jgi:hypothetical protein
LGHAYKEVIIQPTCTQKGVFKNVCTRCSASVVKKELPLAPHKFSEWKQVKAPTCGTAGQNQRICSCGKIETQFVAKLGHDLEHHPAQAASCGQKGWEAYDTCKRCNYSTFKDYIVIGHVMGKPYYIVEPTCTTDGIRAQMCLNCHQVVESVIIARGHFYQEKETPPSCTEDGLIAQRCMLCGDLKDEEVIPALGHNFGDWTVTKEATCFELGESSRSCERCQAIETKEIEKTEHTYQEEIVPQLVKRKDILYILVLFAQIPIRIIIKKRQNIHLAIGYLLKNLLVQQQVKKSVLVTSVMRLKQEKQLRRDITSLLK